MQSEDTPRRGRGGLEADVKTITDSYVTGELEHPEDKPLTPHHIARHIQRIDDLDGPPSTGAVTAVLDKWRDIGFADIATGPTAFLCYTEAAHTEGLAKLKAAHSAARRSARAEERKREQAAGHAA